ncbi:MAG: aminomethyl-transferring glycine dehydrogenase subunit GcvPB, partial [Sphingomicrobium sp.]
MTANPSGWRPTTPANEQADAQTVTGNRALMLEEPLIFEIGTIDQTGVDFDQPSPSWGGLGGGAASAP